MLDCIPHKVDPHTIEEEKIILAKFWHSAAKQINIKNPSLFVDYLLEWAFEKYIPTLFPNTLKTIRYLSRQKYHLCILSNGWPKRLLEIKRSKVGQYFKTILVSSIIGAEKPDTKAYQIALKKIGIPANQVLTIDNKDQYLVPAYQLGMQVLYLDKINFNPNSEFPRIKDISEVIDYVKVFKKEPFSNS